ncbi:hypothetical protein KSS87_013303, partial [Heliosperma pusillum]
MHNKREDFGPSGWTGTPIRVLPDNDDSDSEIQIFSPSPTNSSGSSDMEWHKEHNATEESSTPNLLDKPSRPKHHYPLSGLVSKLFDERISLRKKRKWMDRVATVKKDGTIELELPEDLRDPSLHLGSGVGSGHITELEQHDPSDIQDLPPMQIVMLIVGTRGDVQPFIAIGKRLQEYGHRVRLATHQNFKDFVLNAGLEFFPLGGDPKILIGYMVKNKGFLPSDPSEVHIQRHQLRDIIFSLLPACKDPDPETQIPFNAEAIIANPPAYGHTDVAEALKIPVHVFFTMPW